MRKLILSPICLFALTLHSQNIWIQKSDHPNGVHSRAVCFVINDVAYIGTGVDSTGAVTNDFFSYDPLADTWTQLSDFTGPSRANATAFSIGSYGYVTTGTDYSTNFFHDLWCYDPLLNVWSPKSDLPAAGRMYANAFSLNGYGYVLTGLSGYASSSVLNDMFRYDPVNDSWTQLTFPGVGRGPAVSFVISNKAYFGTGNGSNNFPVNDFWEFDPSNNSWTNKTPLPVVKCGACAFAANGKGYIGTGMDSTNSTNDLWCYDPASDSWIQKPSFPGTARKHATAFSIGNHGYIGLGTASRDLYEFDAVLAGIEPNQYNGGTLIFPSVTTELIHVNCGTYPIVRIEIIDNNGKVLSSERYVNANSPVDVSSYKPGLYFVRITQASGEITTHHFIVGK